MVTSSYFAKHRLIRALLKQPVDMTPVWLMRQAGRYLPEYRAIREKAGDFLTLCKTPELACEVTLQPLKRFPLDGAIFSDILTIPDAMGLGLYFAENEGPKFLHPLQTMKEIEKLGMPDPEIELRYVMDAIRLTRAALPANIPLIGFSGSPWTLATYMLKNARKMMYEEEKAVALLIQKLSEAVTHYLNAQINAGAQVLMIFDTWGGELPYESYYHHSILPIKKIIARLHRFQANGQQIPIILFTKHGGQWLNEMLMTGCDAIGIDWTVSLSRAKKQIGHAVAIQGNLDPHVLYASPAKIEEETGKILANFGSFPGHVFNLGHGVPKDVPVENVGVLVKAVHELSKPYHA